MRVLGFTAARCAVSDSRPSCYLLFCSFVVLDIPGINNCLVCDGFLMCREIKWQLIIIVIIVIIISKWHASIDPCWGVTAYDCPPGGSIFVLSLSGLWLCINHSMLARHRWSADTVSVCLRLSSTASCIPYTISALTAFYKKDIKHVIKVFRCLFGRREMPQIQACKEKYRSLDLGAYISYWRKLVHDAANPWVEYGSRKGKT